MYEIIKIFHILSWTSWMAGMFYLPRILVYHAEKGSNNADISAVFKTMERKLFLYIMKPSMIATWITGIYLTFIISIVNYESDSWIWLKIILVIAMTTQHYFLGKWIQEFSADRNQRSGKFYRIANEIPTVLFIGIVTLIITRPF